MKNKNLNLALSLLTICLISIWYGLHNSLVFKIEFYLGFSLLIFTNFVFLKFKNYANSLFGIILILGLFNIIHFTPFLVGFSFAYLKIQLLSFIFLIFFYVLNRKIISKKIDGFRTTSETDLRIRKKNEIEFFKNQFRNLSETEINKKLKEDLVPEAIEALAFLKNNLTTKDAKSK